jgi:hypothetical protein
VAKHPATTNVLHSTFQQVLQPRFSVESGPRRIGWFENSVWRYQLVSSITKKMLMFRLFAVSVKWNRVITPCRIAITPCSNNSGEREQPFFQCTQTLVEMLKKQRSQ